MDDSKPESKGHLHPMSQLIAEIERIFGEMSFEVAVGPEIETEFYNFDALRVAKDHPARDMQDTFWLKDVNEKGERLLPRTQTSPVQIHFMEQFIARARAAGKVDEHGALIIDSDTSIGFRIIAPGKVFRNEATDATHEAEFFQLEGMLVAPKVSLADLKGTLSHFFKQLLGSDSEVRFRPSFFPFVEPAVEVDVKWKDRWLEVMGAGLVHPDVLRAGGFDPEKWQGFAFGGGIDRLAMLRYGIDDIRLLYSGDLRFINQF